MTDRSPTIVRERVAKNWCLFLDRDGVINTRIIDGYVRNWAEFEFVPGVLDAIRTLARWAPHIVVVTNQQGVGKGIMSAADLSDIHDRMRRAVADAGGRIDAVQHCPHLAGDGCDCRKPKPGMAEEYLTAHPEIEPSLSIMIGDTDSDIEMGRRLAAVTGGCVDPRADATYPSLADFAAAIEPFL
jgi:D-glycero-D-manno-heptose 1,7-bisphosphate phosphatase